MKNFWILGILLFMVSCASTRVTYDYDKETDFSGYNTYNYYPDIRTGLSELDYKRLIRVLDIALQGKGLLFSDEPDFLINIEGNSFQAANNTSVGVGVGGTGRNVGGGVSIGIPVGRPDQQRILQFDFVDTKKDELFWQAVSTSTIKDNAAPEIRELKFRELVEKVLSKYPPKTKK